MPIPGASGTTWVVVADGRKAVFLRNLDTDMSPNLRPVRDVGRIVQESDQSTGRPGRASAPGSSHRSAFEEADWHGLPEAQFAKDIADRLYRALMRHEFDRLVIAAPPKALGELRRDLHKEVAARVVTDIGKDLTNSTLDDIEAHVRDALAAATGGRVTIDQPDELAAGGKRFGARRD